ncbi:MAG: sulfotransferase [Planctomycetes bacterium]|nr:sulfotransferase [Planctomycetota bacterium]
MPNPLIITGTARSGSTLLCRMLSAHRQIMVAADPFFPVFKAIRNAVLESSSGGRPAGFNPDMPFQDYYFSQTGIECMDALLCGRLNTPCGADEWRKLRERTAERAAIECPDLAGCIPQMAGPNYKTILDRGLEAIAKVRSCGSHKWVGFKEVWIIDFTPLLAEAYPDARFIVISRDPRAIVASLLNIARKDPTQMAHVLSFVRHWRKYAAFIEHFAGDERLNSRIFHIKYEDLMADPERILKDACEFLQVGYDEKMTDAGSFRDYATGGVWQGNSSYEGRGAGIDRGLAESWRKHLPAEVVSLVDFICDPDMRLLGYKPVEPSADCTNRPGVLEYIIRTNAGQYSWRSDFMDAQMDYGFELFRKAMIESPSPIGDGGMVRRSFLFEDVYRKIRSIAGPEAKNG